MSLNTYYPLPPTPPKKKITTEKENEKYQETF